MAGEDLIAVRTVCQIYVNIRMSGQITFGAVILKSCKHGTVLHIVSIDDGMKITEISAVAGFKKDTAGLVAFLSECVGQIIAIIRSMHHG